MHRIEFLSFQLAYDLFIQSRESFCRDRSVENYINTIGYFRDYLVESTGISADQIDIRALTLQDLNLYSIYLRNKPKHSNHPYFVSDESVKISARTRKDYLTDMKAFLNFLNDNGQLDLNPLVGFRMPKVERKIIEPLTADEVRIIDDAYQLDVRFGCRNLLIIHLLLDEGMRSGEVMRLKLGDVNLDEGYIVIRNAKGGKSRVLPIARVVRKYLVRYIDCKRPETSHSFLLCTDEGKPLTSDSIKGIFARLKAATQITRIYPHLLRHTFGSSYVLGGGSLEVLKNYMGHASLETTEKYLHIANDFRFCTNIYRLDPVFLKKFY